MTRGEGGVQPSHHLFKVSELRLDITLYPEMAKPIICTQPNGHFMRWSHLGKRFIWPLLATSLSPGPPPLDHHSTSLCRKALLRVTTRMQLWNTMWKRQMILCATRRHANVSSLALQEGVWGYPGDRHLSAWQTLVWDHHNRNTSELYNGTVDISRSNNAAGKPPPTREGELSESPTESTPSRV